ncbi:MAG: AraC family transcriptional regulator [Chromatiales bacterium]
MSASAPTDGETVETKHALGEILRRISFQAEVFYRGQLCDSWALDTSGTGNVNFHLVCHGQCWLHMPGVDSAVELNGGDIVVFPHDAAHVIGSTPERPSAFGIKTVTREVPLDKAQQGTALICGYLVIDRTARQLLLASLPEHIVIATVADSPFQCARTLLDLLFAEASMDAVGSAAILDRLSDALMFYVVRAVVRDHLGVCGLIGALGDPHLRRAVLSISLGPARRWTVHSLAEEAHLSRAVFAERFLKVCGMPPIEFLTIWRMHLARRWLEHDHASVLDVADRCGYESAAAFSKAFKRIMGAGPGQFRRIGAARGREPVPSNGNKQARP